MYESRNIIDKIPSIYVNFPSKVVSKSKIVLPKSIGKSILIMSLSTFICFAIIAEIDNTNRILVMFDPATFAITISEFPFKTALIDVAISGNEVPNATIVTPIIKEGILKNNPIFSAVSVNQSADLINTASAAKNAKVHNAISMFLF